VALETDATQSILVVEFGGGKEENEVKTGDKGNAEQGGMMGVEVGEGTDSLGQTGQDMTSIKQKKPWIRGRVEFFW